jgi:hypothetical protein
MDKNTVVSRVIPAVNLEALTVRVRQLSRRAAKLKLPGLILHTGERSFKERRDEITDTVYRTELVEVSIAGDAPRLDGWRLIVVLDHDTPDRKPLARTVPGETAPPNAEARGAICDHCHTNRKRYETFIVAHDDGRLAWVGRDCLQDFLGGKTPEALLFAASWLAELVAAMDEDGPYGFSVGGGEAWHDATAFLSWVAGSIRSDGWLSRGKAREQGLAGRATADLAYGDMTWRGSGKPPAPPTLEDVATAKAALAWAQALPEGASDDYLDKLGRVARWDRVSAKYSGILASAIPAHQRDLKRRLEANRAVNSKHIGQPKERLRNLAVTVTFQTALESEWGATILYRMLTSDGNALIYYSSRSLEIETGASVTIDATVKRHDNDRKTGVPVTVITRATVKAVAAA